MPEDKKITFYSWAKPFTVPPELNKEESDNYRAQHELNRAAYYAQFPHTQDLAKWCQAKAMIYSPEKKQN